MEGLYFYYGIHAQKKSNNFVASVKEVQQLTSAEVAVALQAFDSFYLFLNWVQRQREKGH